MRIHVVFLLPEISQVTSAASDPELSFTITSCFISPNSNPSVPSDYILIEMVCPKDDSVQFYAQRDVPFSHRHMEKKRFGFKFNSNSNLSLLFLHCEMSLCSKTSQTNSKLPPVRTITLVFSFIDYCHFSSGRKKSLSFFPPPQTLNTQCLQSSETCDSFSVNNIMVMMMNTKTATKPLVVLDAPPGPPPSPGQNHSDTT